MSPLPPPPARRWSYFLLRLVLIAAIVTLLIRINANYFFHTPTYETGDLAANSLSVLRAEHAQELYGNYSRWEFHHPGPAMFYGEGWAELALFRWGHVVPTPYTAQILFNLLLMSSFFAAGISIAARWMRGGMFIILALLLAVLDFAGPSPVSLLLINWPPYVVALALFALLVAAASVAAGQGDDLTLLVLAGCFLLHMHVAQPLFVVPMFTLAYLGLVWSCWRRSRAVVITTGTEPAPAVSPSPGTRSALPWRVYRWSHRWALLIAALFALPILIDLFHGKDSNFALIVEHLRSHHGQNHSYLDSLDYFLRYAVYQPSLPNAPDALTTHATLPKIGHFIGHHPEMTGLWLAALLSPLLVVAVRVWRGTETPLLGSQPTAQPVAYASPGGRWRFLGCLWLVWALSVGLTLVWGHIQDGQMFYFNAWFNYTIWYTLALLAAGSLTDVLDALTFRSERPFAWRGFGVLLCACLVGYTFHARLSRLQIGDDPGFRVQAQNVAAVLDNEPANTPRAKLLIFPHEGWGDAAGIAVLLARRDRTAYVLPRWSFMFGNDHLFKEWENYVSKPAEVNTPFEVWHLVPSSMVPTALADRRLNQDFTLAAGGLPINPSGGFQINCAGQNPNCLGYLGSGWAPEGGEYAWTEAKTSWMQFRPIPVPRGENVTLTFDWTPNLVPGKRDAQRAKMFFNGLEIGSLRVADKGGKPNQFVIPGDVWNKYPSVLLVMEFPDAISPAETSESGDTRPLAFQVRSLTFATTPPPKTAPVPVPTPVPGESPTLAVPAEVTPPLPVDPVPTPPAKMTPLPADESTPTSAEPTPPPKNAPESAAGFTPEPTP